MRIFIIILFVGLICVNSISLAYSEEVLLDMIAPLGDFENAGSITNWASGYVSSSFNWTSYSSWAVTKEGNSYYGTIIASENDMVGCGWTRKSGSDLNPVENLIYQIVNNPDNGTKCQYMAVKNVDSTKNVSVQLTHEFNYAKYGLGPKIGDTLVFSIDYIKMSDFSALNGYYRLFVKCTTYANGTYGESSNRNILLASATPYADKIEITIPNNTIKIQVGILIEGKVTDITQKPGIYLDKAHLYLKRSGKNDFENIQIPIEKNRSCDTFVIDYGQDDYDELYFAKNYDNIIIQRNEQSYISKIKYLNPNAKIYKYVTQRITKSKDVNKDPYMSNAGLGYYTATSEYAGLCSDWFYTNGTSPEGYVYESGSYDTYYAKFTSSSFQEKWAAEVIKKTSFADYDGVFIDDSVPYLGETTTINGESKVLKPDLKSWEIQNFMHSVIPLLDAKNIQSIWNACLLSASSIDFGNVNKNGVPIFNPYWQPDDTYKTPDYSANSYTSTPTAFFQEWAFFYPNADRTQIIWNKKHWKTCLDDMNAVKQWNDIAKTNGVSEQNYKYYYCSIQGVDSAQCPIGGVNGWFQFALSSYLLGQNEFTTFGAARTLIEYSSNLSITKKLGISDGSSVVYNNDDYCRYRLYKAGNGGVGGVVVVNANTDVNRNFTLNFDAVDENDKPVKSGTVITLLPNTGRIFLKSEEKLYVYLSIPDTAIPGQFVDITVNYINMSGSSLINSSIESTVSSGMTFISDLSDKSGVYDNQTRQIKWSIPEIPAGAQGQLIFKVLIN